MLRLTLLCLILSLANAVYGFTGVLAAAAEIAGLLFVIFSFLLFLALVTELHNRARMQPRRHWSQPF